MTVWVLMRGHFEADTHSYLQPDDTWLPGRKRGVHTARTFETRARANEHARTLEPRPSVISLQIKDGCAFTNFKDHG